MSASSEPPSKASSSHGEPSKSPVSPGHVPREIRHTQPNKTEENHHIITEQSEKDDDGTPIHATVSHGSQLPMSRARTIALVVTLTGAAFLNTLSIQAAVIILPIIGRDLDIPDARQQWIVSAYSLTFGCFLLLWGRVADVYGKRLIFLGGSAWVCLVTLLCPFIPDEIGFDVFRALQGLGAAANVPTAIGILGVTFPLPGPAKNYAFAAYASGAPMGSVIGNLLGGVVGQYASWKWVFWILAIIAAGVTVGAYFVIPVPKPRARDGSLTGGAVDWIGGATITVALLLLLFALTEGNVVGWSTAWVPVVIAVSVLMMVAFVLWQLHLERHAHRRPLLKVSIFQEPTIAAAMVSMAFFFSSFNAFLIFATYFYQEYQGLDAIQTTVRFIPTGVVGIMTVFVTSQILARIRLGHILVWGMLCCTIACLLFAVPIPPDTTYWAYGFPAMCLSVLGVDTVFPSLVVYVSQSLPKENQAVGGATISAMGQIGRALGLAIGTAIQVAVEGARSHDRTSVSSTIQNRTPAYLAGLRAAEWFNVGVGLAGVLIVAVAFRHTGIIGGGHH